MKSKVARAISADPDIVLYMAFLCSNRASAAAKDALDLLRDLTVSVEGWKFTQPEPAQPTKLQRAADRTRARPFVDAAELAALQAAADKYLRQELAPAVAVRGRYQAKGAEAVARYGTQKAALLKKWAQLKSLLVLCRREPRLNADKVRTAAADLPLENLTKTLATGFQPETATEYTVQVAAAVAAVQALGREISVKYRLRISGAETFPSGVSASALFSGETVASITTVPSPRKLGIKSGDLVSWGRGTGTVTSVGATTIGVGSSTIETVDGVLEISPAAWSSLRTMTAAVLGVDKNLPSTGELAAALTRGEERSAAHIKALVRYLVTLMSRLDAVPASAAATAARVDVDVPEQSFTLLGVLDAYAPSFAAKTSAAGESLLNELESTGADYAADVLLGGNVAFFLDMDEDDRSRLGRLEGASNLLSSYTSPVR